jgi:hypothetical protein
MKNSNQSILEKVMKDTHKDYEKWTNNFALNLENIWKENSDRKSNKVNVESQNSAIVIGGGPSLIRKNHLEILSESKYKGTIIVVDRVLKKALDKGVTPEKFEKFFVTSIEPYDRIESHFDHKIIDEFGKNITGMFPVISSPKTISRVKEAGIKIRWFHPLIDYNEGIKSFNGITAHMIKAKKNIGLPALQTGGNVGTTSWFIGWQILKCSTVGLIGMNHGWDEKDNPEKIITHGHEDPNAVIDSSITNMTFTKIYNPDFDCYCIMDPIYQFYSNALKEFIARSPKWLSTINATEGGSIFGEKIISMKLLEFLKKNKGK